MRFAMLPTLALLAACVTVPVVAEPLRFVTYGTASGLGNNNTYGVFVSGSTVYVATGGGLSISTNVGTSFTNKTTSNGLGSNTVRGVFAVGSTVYAATSGNAPVGGVSKSTNSGTSFTNSGTSSGLSRSGPFGIFAVGSNVYAATLAGLGVSTNGGTTYTNKTNASGLGSTNTFGVYASGSTVYVATGLGLSISTNAGTSFTNSGTSSGLGASRCTGVYASGSTVYAATDGGLSISTDGGSTYTNFTTANGLGNNTVRGVFASGSTVYAATSSGFSIGSPDSLSLIWTATTGTWSASANTWTTSSGGAAVFIAGDTVTFSGTAGGTLTLSGTLAPASLVVSATAGTYTFSGGVGNRISGSGALEKSGAGVAVFTSDNDRTGRTTLSAGTIRVGTDGALGSGTLSLDGGTIASAGASARALWNRVIFGGDVAIGDGTGTGAMTLGGEVDLGGGTRSLTTVVDTTLSGTIGNGGLTKLGAGRLILTASNTYTGTTTISAGRLSVNGALSDSPVMVLAAAEFGGSGSIGGPVSVASGGTLAPGNSIESLATGTATFAAGAVFEYEVDSTNPLSLGSAADLLVVNGSLNLDPGNATILTLTDLAGSPSLFVYNTTIFALVNYSGSWNGGLFTLGGNVLADGEWFTIGSQEWEIDYNRTSAAGIDNFTGDFLPGGSFVTITAVPEPSTYTMALAGIACGGLSMWRRRKRA